MYRYETSTNRHIFYPFYGGSWGRKEKEEGHNILYVGFLLYILGNAPQEQHNLLNQDAFSDADMERLLDEWEEKDEDILEEDELPPHKRKQKPVDMDTLKAQVRSFSPR